MKSHSPETFHINYQQQKLKVQPVVEDGHTHYHIIFPSHTLEIFRQPDTGASPYWHERKAGKSLLAQQLGEKIEESLA